MNELRSFTDLKVWQQGHQLVLHVYKITRHFPPEEKFGLMSQIRRSAVSITSNIAEGFSRRNRKEKVQFYRIARASLVEMQNQILIAKDVGYLSEDAFQEIAQQSISNHKLLNTLIRSIPPNPPTPQPPNPLTP